MLDLSSDSARSSMSFIDNGCEDMSSISAMMMRLDVGLTPWSDRTFMYFSCFFMVGVLP